jgi:hypothetical protein
MTADEFVYGIDNHVARYCEGQPDPEVVLKAAGSLCARALAAIVQASHLFPDETEALLTSFYTELYHHTLIIIHDGDAQTSGC